MIARTDDIKTNFFKKWIYLFSARLLPLIVLFIITLLFSRNLSYSDYGRFQEVWMYVNIINVVITFGYTTLLLSTGENSLRQFIDENKKSISVFYAVLVFITLLVFYFYATSFKSSTFLLVGGFSLLQVICLIKETRLVKKGKENRLFLINSIYAIFFLAWHLFILYHQYDLNQLITGVIVLSILKLFFLDTGGPSIVKNAGGISTEPISIAHWFFLGMNDITGVLSKWIDKIFLLYFLSSSDFAIFFNGSFEIPLFGLLITVAGNLLLVDVSSSIGNTHKVIQSFNTNYRLLSAIVFPIFFFLLFDSKELFAVLFNHRYDASVPIFVISLFLLPIRINNYGALLQCYSKGRTVMEGSVLDIIIVILLMFILYPLLSTKGVAIAVVAGTYCQIIYYLIRSAKLLKVSLIHLFPAAFLTKKLLFLLLMYGVFSFIPIGFVPYGHLISGGLITILIIFAGLIKFNRLNTVTAYGNHSEIQQ